MQFASSLHILYDRIANIIRLDYFLSATVLRVLLGLYEMASSEKQMIPLEDISLRNEGKPPDMGESPSPADLVDVKFPSRPRRKVVIIAGVIAVIIVVAVTASLIGKYVPEYLSERNSKCKW